MLKLWLKNFVKTLMNTVEYLTKNKFIIISMTQNIDGHITVASKNRDEGIDDHNVIFIVVGWSAFRWTLFRGLIEQLFLEEFLGLVLFKRCTRLIVVFTDYSSAFIVENDYSAHITNKTQHFL